MPRQPLLAPSQAREVRLSLETDEQIADRLGVSQPCISRTRCGDTHGPLAPDEHEARAARRDRRRTLGPYANRAAPVGPRKTLPSTGAVRLGDNMLIVGDLFARDGLVGQDRQEVKDAAHECGCGRLPHDSTPVCGCWPQEHKTNPQQEEATNGSHRERLDRFAQQARDQDRRPAPSRPVPA